MQSIIKDEQLTKECLYSLWNRVDEQLTEECIYYLADYINEEIDRGNDISSDTIKDAIDAFNGGAR